MNYTLNIKWEYLQWVTERSRQNCHIEILNFTIFIPVPNSGSVHLKITKWSRIWDGDQYKKIVYPLYSVCQISLFIYIVSINWDDRQGKIDCSCQNCHIKIFNFTNFVPVPNSVGVYFKITNCSRIWDGDQYKKLKHDLQGVFKISLLFYIVNIKLEDLLQVTECSRQNYHIEILNLTFFVPVPNFGGIYLKS